MKHNQHSAKHYLHSKIDLNDTEMVAAYDELPLWSAMLGLMLLEHVPLSQNLRVLDVGCGTGFPVLELAQRLGPTCTVVGLDTWEAALERARFKARVLGVKNVDIRQGDATAMPFGEAEFDLVVSNLGLNNFNNPEAAVAECKRVMKAGATLALTTNLQGHMREFYAVFESTLGRRSHGGALAALRKHVAHRATVAGVRALLRRHGFRVTQVRRESRTMRFAIGTALFRHHFIQLGFLGAWKEILRSKEREQVFSRIEGNLNALAARRGELALTIPMAYIEAKVAES